ncbi:MAG: hypothetical protein LC112_15235 [Flavobacteriales bacterium]|nr:hypothetical protein [Flavobacteriales bacterium]
MKILIIAPTVGKTAPGIVFEKLIFGLSKHHQIDVLTSEYLPASNLTDIHNVYTVNKTKINGRAFKFLIALLSFSPYDYLWAYKSFNKIKGEKYDLVFSMMSYHHYFGLISGVLISKKLDTKLAVYSVDGVPAPNGWPENKFYYKGVCNLIKKNLPFADAFFASNEQMLKYQLGTFVNKPKLVADVLLNPGATEFKEYEYKNKTNIFLYTGAIYSVRKAEYLVRGFEMLLSKYPTSKLIFVGTRLSDELLGSLSNNTRKHIEMREFTTDLSNYYKEATALIDIDADIENDVFLSSKITNYLMINRIIISETGKNSPSRILFKNIKSIIQCSHDSVELCHAMEYAIKQGPIMEYEDRKDVITKFKIETVVNNLNKHLTHLADYKENINGKKDILEVQF